MVTNTNYGNNPQVPAAFDSTYLPDLLVGGVYPRVTDSVTLKQSGLLKRGTPLGKVAIGAAAAAAKSGGNTGNGTISAVTIQAGNTKPGVYQVRFTSATAFAVTDPLGRQIKTGSTGSAFATDVGFTITAGGTPFVAGDGFDITVAAGSGKYVASVATALDGSQAPVAILADTFDASGADVAGAGIYRTGEFNENAVSAVMDGSWTLSAIKPLLAASNIYLKSALSAADPS